MMSDLLSAPRSKGKRNDYVFRGPIRFCLTLFIYLFIYDKGPESATDMPMTVNSKLTHYKIRQTSTENKRLKNRQTAKMV